MNRAIVKDSRFMQRIRSKSVKTILRWLVLAAVVFFLVQTLQKNWAEVTKLRIDAAGLACIAIAIGVTLFAHIFAGFVWAWILRFLSYPVSGAWGAQTYLTTNLAKYLPGNVWHFYGRITAAKRIGIPVEAATLSLLLEVLLMIGAGCLVAIVRFPAAGFQWIVAGLILIAVHPVCLNPVLKQVGKLKNTTPMRLARYPLLPLLGELGFLGLRAIGFILTFQALRPVNGGEVPLLVSSFAWAWVTGLVTPGLPGGVGVFEVVCVALLSQAFPSGQVLGAVAIYRLVNTVAEGLGAGLGAVDGKARSR